MDDQLLCTTESARRLGISVASLYDWLARSDQGDFYIRGQAITVDYLQGGSKGQGRILIEEKEVERLKDAMRVRPQSRQRRPSPVRRQHFPGITVPLGRPNLTD
jgi:hypothetical protein